MPNPNCIETQGWVAPKAANTLARATHPPLEQLRAGSLLHSSATHPPEQVAASPTNSHRLPRIGERPG